MAAAVLPAAGAALAARGYTDVADDANAAPDITSLDVSELTAGMLTIRVSIGNFQALPANSWVNLWFDVDSDPRTGDAGDEALVRYSADGGMELFTWNGLRLVEGATAGVSGTFSAGVLTLSLPRAAINSVGAFGILAVTSRGQIEGTEQLIASDYAPNVGRSSFTRPAAAFPDPANDHDAAPDLTAVRVSDAKSGWVAFGISTPNYETLPAESVLFLFVDVDNNVRTGEDGVDARITVVGREVALEWWEPNSKDWLPDDLPTRARVRSARNVVSGRRARERARQHAPVRLLAREPRREHGSPDGASGRLRTERLLLLALRAGKQADAEAGRHAGLCVVESGPRRASRSRSVLRSHDPTRGAP